MEIRGGNFPVTDVGLAGRTVLFHAGSITPWRKYHYYFSIHANQILLGKAEGEIGSSPVLYLYSTYVTRDRMCDLLFNSFIRDRPLFSSLKGQTVLCGDNESTSRKIRPQGQYIFTIQHGVY
jgi:hypothetical protein